MVMRDALEVADGTFEVHDGDELMNKLRGFRAYNMSSKNDSSSWVAQHFDMAMSLAEA